MARFALGAKCGKPGSPVAACVVASWAVSVASAAVPKPIAPARKKCRRVIACICSRIGSIAFTPLLVLDVARHCTDPSDQCSQPHEQIEAVEQDPHEPQRDGPAAAFCGTHAQDS